ncbi:MAG: Gfo/Idh/MocA family oxidoreductase [Acidimicrobiia bacterium]|nr:Gfo/Idh/MocA family oxidoreductase [Acidimicrobiia bacterium]
MALKTPAHLQIAVVGAGSMGSLHARVVSQSSRAVLTCVVDPDPGAGKELAARFGAEWWPELDEPERFDAVIVASPPRHAPSSSPGGSSRPVVRSWSRSRSPRTWPRPRPSWPRPGVPVRR